MKNSTLKELKNDIHAGNNIIVFATDINRRIVNNVIDLAKETGRGNSLLFLDAARTHDSIKIAPFAGIYTPEEMAGHCFATQTSFDLYCETVANRVLVDAIKAVGTDLLSSSKLLDHVDLDKVNIIIDRSWREEWATAFKANIAKKEEYPVMILGYIGVALACIHKLENHGLIQKDPGEIPQRLYENKPFILIIDCENESENEIGIIAGNALLGTVASFLGRKFFASYSKLASPLSCHIGDQFRHYRPLQEIHDYGGCLGAHLKTICFTD